MSANRSTKLRILCVFALLVLLAGAGTILYAGRLRRARENAEALKALLSATDKALAAGNTEAAAASLSEAIGLGGNEPGRLRIMKRALLLCSERADYAQLVDWVLKARESAAFSPALTHLAVYAALRSNQAELTQKLLSERRTRRLVRTESDFQYLAAEAALRRNNVGGDAALPPELKTLLALERGGHPALLIDQGKMTGDKRFFLDAALLWMKRGQVRNALATLNTFLPDAYPEPAAYISYDAGDMHEASRRAALLVRGQPERADYRRFYGDIMFRQQRYEQARDMYLRALRLESPGSWQTTLNLAASLERSGDQDSAHVYTARAYAAFPNNKDVLTRQARSLAREGKREQAVEILRQHLMRYPDDPEINLLHLQQLMGDAATPGNYRTELWKLYNRVPDNPGVARALLEYLLSFADLESAALVISRYRDAASSDGNDPWLLQAEAIYAALKGDYQAAETLLLAKVETADSWDSRYNLALVLGAADRYAEGVRELISAESLVATDSGRESPYRSLIRSKLGEYYIRLGDTVSARRELAYALELDPANMHPRLILKKLDEDFKK